MNRVKQFTLHWCDAWHKYDRGIMSMTRWNMKICLKKKDGQLYIVILRCQEIFLGVKNDEQHCYRCNIF